MASTVESCESNPPGLSAHQSTMEIFDTFKSSLKEDDKDSDEESFHLPMLGCDDDTDSNCKDITSGTNTPIAENEDDILNKFETAGTPDIDPNVEETMLKDIDDEDLSTNRDKTENDKLSNVAATENSVGEERHSGSSGRGDIFKDLEIVDELDDAETLKEQEDSETKDCQGGDPPAQIANIILENGEDRSDENNAVENKDSLPEEPQQSTEAKVAMVTENVAEETEESKIEETDAKDAIEEAKTSEESAQDGNVDEIIEEDISEKIIDDQADNSTEDSNNIEESVPETVDVDKEHSKQSEASIQDDDVSKHSKPNGDEIEEQSIEEGVVENCDEVAGVSATATAEEVEPNVKQSSGVESTEESKTEETKMNCEEDDDNLLKDLVKEVNNKIDTDEDELMPEAAILDAQLPSNPDELIEDSNKSDKVENSSPDSEATVEYNSSNEAGSETKAAVSNETAMETDLVEVAEETDPLKTEQTVASVQETDKPSEESVIVEKKQLPSSQDISASNLECDDLLDVSIIRDLDEDDAENAAQSSEKSDNDDQEDDKADNEIEESEVDQEETVISSDKDERVDSEDGNSNMCDQEISTNEDVTSDAVGDSESKDDDDVVMKETEVAAAVLEKLITVDDKDEQKNKPEGNKEEALKENVLSFGKRPLSDTDDVEIENKKPRLSDVNEDNTATEKTKKASSKGSNLKTLISFESFMQNKKFSNTKLTRSDLEQFCLQKICEAIMHKTDVGELHQTIKKQEQVIENLRKDLLQLSKQTRDLDIVNKKLMNELKTQNGTKKPLVPLKITRSVGLQVKLNIGIDQTPRRKQTVPTTPKTPTTPANNTSVLRTRNITPANANVVRQVHQTSVATTTTTTPAAPSPRKSATNTPILSQALQNRPTPIAPKRGGAVRAKVLAELPKPANPGVIDLTDEDDKAAKNVQQNKGAQQLKNAQQVKTVQATPMKILNKNMPVVQQMQQRTVNILQNKAGNKIVGQANVGQQIKGGARTVATLPQGVRLTSTQLKNGLTLPASVVTSNASGTPQLMYVVQPSSLVTSTAGGTQKTVLLNFQPTSQVLTSTINGSTVSMLSSKGANTVPLKTIVPRKHPAPLPLPPPASLNSSLKSLLPKPHLSIRKTDTGIILQWRMPYNLDVYEGIASYQLFAYQETNAPPSTDMWRKVGDVKALALPMACTLTQFADKNKYYFAVRSVDVHKRIGAFSDPEEISL